VIVWAYVFQSPFELVGKENDGPILISRRSAQVDEVTMPYRRRRP
jgi:hypothetical protein